MGFYRKSVPQSQKLEKQSVILMLEGHLILLYIYDIISLNKGPMYTIQQQAYSPEHPLCTARSKLRAHSSERVKIRGREGDTGLSRLR